MYKLIFKETAFGSIKASDVDDVSKPRQRDANTNKSISAASDTMKGVKNLQAYQTNASMLDHGVRNSDGAKSPSSSPDVEVIYANVVSAISRSLLHILAKSARYVPLTMASFIAAPINVGSCTQETEEYGLDDPIASAEFSLNVQWLSCGALVILSHPFKTPRWYNLIDRHPEPHQVVRLSPLGIFATFNSFVADTDHRDDVPASSPREMFVDTEDQAYSADLPYQASIQTFLRRYGITITNRILWASVSINIPSNPLDDKSGLNNMQELLWPAHLCFHEATRDIDDPTDSLLWGGARIATIDPLAEAEQWYLGKESREMALREHRRSQEQQSNMQAHGASSEDDSISGLFPITVSQGDVHGMTGIYPTPPDGFQSQAMATSTDREIAGSIRDKEGLQGTNRNTEVDDTQGTDGSHVQSPDGSMQLGDYDNDDLFGDYTANGLTEADFSFFDEPDVDGHQTTSEEVRDMKILAGASSIKSPQTYSNNFRAEIDDSRQEIFEQEADAFSTSKPVSKVQLRDSRLVC